jgi:hypothetical protein
MQDIIFTFRLKTLKFFSLRYKKLYKIYNHSKIIIWNDGSLVGIKPIKLYYKMRNVYFLLSLSILCFFNVLFFPLDFHFLYFLTICNNVISVVVYHTFCCKCSYYIYLIEAHKEDSGHA